MKNATKMKNQSILCDVKVCTYNNSNGSCCSLEQITVTPMQDDKSAHYCKDYKHK